MRQWVFCASFSGAPLGKGISPILASVCLAGFDAFVEAYKKSFDICIDNASKAGSAISGSCLQEYALRGDLAMQMQAAAPAQTAKKQILYHRCASSFIFGVNGSKEDCRKLKTEIILFFRERLKADIAEDKLIIAHSSKKTRFLGYDIAVRWTNNAKQHRFVRLAAPNELLAKMLVVNRACKMLKGKGGIYRLKPIHRASLACCPNGVIFARFQSEMRMARRYYALACNANALQDYLKALEYSLYKTFANKYRTSVRKVKSGHAGGLCLSNMVNMLS
jgi:hypothetical protein